MTTPSLISRIQVRSSSGRLRSITRREDPPHNPRAPHRPDHTVTTGDGHRHLFPATASLARLGRRDRLAGVEVKRRRDINGVNPRVGQQLAPAGIVLAGAEFSRKTLGQFGAGAADRHQLARGRVP